MTIVERSPSQQPRVAGSKPHSDRLRVITAGSVGNMEVRLGTSGFDVVGVAETEDALIDAVSAHEPDAIVVEADLCPSLEHVRDLAPDAVLIAVGDHTPAGALGRIERGVSGTVMAGILHALVAEGVGGAVAWGLVPAFRSVVAPQAHPGAGGSLMSPLADLVRAHLPNALRDHADLVTAAGTIAVAVSASLLLTLGAPRTHEGPQRIPVPAPAVERAPLHAIYAASPTTRTSSDAPPSRSEGQPGDRGGPDRARSGGHGRRDHPSGHGRRDHPSGHASRPPGVAYGWDHRPPKHADNGNHTGWSDNSVPADLPPGSVNAGGRSGRATGPPCQPASPPCNGG